MPAIALETKTVLLTESPFFAVRVSNILTGEPLDGYVTFQDDFISLEVENGQAQIGCGMQIRKDALAEPIIEVNYTFNAQDGFYKNLDLINKDGQSVSEAWYIQE